MPMATIIYDSRFVGVRRSVSVSEQEAPTGRAAPETEALTLQDHDNSGSSFPRTFNHSELEWARRLLDGSAGGTVIDWKRH